MNIYGTTSSDFLVGTAGDDRISGSYGNDSIFGDWIDGSQSNTELSTLFANPGNDYLIGGAGNDSILSLFGNDRLYGGSGNDAVIGVGNLYGGDGNDSLGNTFQGISIEHGGRGADIFNPFFNAIPEQFIPGTTQPLVYITDFNPNEGDRLHLSAQDNVGNVFGFYDPNHPNTRQVFDMFNSNHDNKLTADDYAVDPTADGKGIELHWWASTLIIDHTTSVSPDWIV